MAERKGYIPEGETKVCEAPGNSHGSTIETPRRTKKKPGGKRRAPGWVTKLTKKRGRHPMGVS